MWLRCSPFRVASPPPAASAMRSALAFCAILLAAAATAPAAAQAPFPSRPIKFLIPFPGGGLDDVLSRIAADKLTTKWGQTIVVENRTGAGGNIAAEFAAQAEGDGTTLFIAPPGPLAVNQSLYRRLAYRPEDFVAITVLAEIPNLVIVRPELALNTLADLIAFREEKPRQAHLWVAGQRLHPASDREHVHDRGGGEPDPRALSRREFLSSTICWAAMWTCFSATWRRCCRSIGTAS